MNRLDGRYAWRAELGSEGQLEIPEEVLRALSLKEGDALVMIADEAQGIAIPPKEPLTELAAHLI